VSKDPVCGMTVDEKSTIDKSEFQGTTFYFCSPGCKKSFDKEPHKYAHGDSHGAHR
jgi:Cu+-exporting ATPase